jgi:hypothetical protein
MSDQPWQPVTIGGRAYQLQPLGAEPAFELDATLLGVFGESFAAALAHGLEDIMPALMLQVEERFSVCVTWEDVVEELQTIRTSGVQDLDTVEWIGRILLALAKPMSELVSDVVPRATERITPAMAKRLVQVCVFGHAKYQLPSGTWIDIRNWADLDNALAHVAAGPARQMHKWALLLGCIRATWGPSGAADATSPVERHTEVDPRSSPPPE